MIGVILSSIGTFFTEVSESIGKIRVTAGKESLYTFAVLQLFGAWLMFLVLALAKTDLLVFSLASLPTFFLRLILEIAQHYAMFMAVIRSDRSTYSFVRLGTLPLLLAVDVALGYGIREGQIFGIGLILASVFLVFLGHQFTRKGMGFLIFSTVNGVATISLFKYNISRFNSVAGEQLVMLTLLLLFFIGLAAVVGRENPFRHIWKPVYSGQAASMGLGVVLESFAYNFAPASIILGAKRASAALWAILAGNMYFHERHIVFKLAVFMLLASGIVLLVV